MNLITELPEDCIPAKVQYRPFKIKHKPIEGFKRGAQASAINWYSLHQGNNDVFAGLLVLPGGGLRIGISQVVGGNADGLKQELHIEQNKDRSFQVCGIGTGKKHQTLEGAVLELFDMAHLAGGEKEKAVKSKAEFAQACSDLRLLLSSRRIYCDGRRIFERRLCGHGIASASQLAGWLFRLGNEFYPSPRPHHETSIKIDWMGRPAYQISETELGFRGAGWESYGYHRKPFYGDLQSVYRRALKRLEKEMKTEASGHKMLLFRQFLKSEMSRLKTENAFSRPIYF